MDLENIMLSEVNKVEKGKYCMRYIYQYKNIYLYVFHIYPYVYIYAYMESKIVKLIKTESKMEVTRDCGGFGFTLCKGSN